MYVYCAFVPVACVRGLCGLCGLCVLFCFFLLQVRDVRDSAEGANYGGEATGIRSHLSRSRKIEN